MAILNTNDGTRHDPYLRNDINVGTWADLPPFSSMPKFAGDEIYSIVKAAGFSGIQGADPAKCRSYGLGATAGGRVNRIGEAAPMARQWKDAGFQCATLHVAWGLEDDDQTDRLVDDILSASVLDGFPLYIETHRATITNDPWRTVRIARKFPEVRFNGDFSHWYTGAEMTYGDLAAKFDFLSPVFDRVRFIHGRIGNSGCIQVDIGDGVGRSYVDHFKEIWIRSFMGFLRSATPGDYICFVPELLPPETYARTFAGPVGRRIEEGDRWQQAILYRQIATECFAQAGHRLEQGKGAD